MEKNTKENLIGRTFGYYEVIDFAPPHIAKSGSKTTMWKCRCVCGKVKNVSTGHLKNRPNISCGCMRRTTLEDLTGKTFNYLRVDSRAPSVPKSDGKKRTMWNCTCLLCGTKTVIAASDLKSGHRISCGCIISQLRSKAHLIDHTGEIIGRLYVESRAADGVKQNGAKYVLWNCICQCGNRCVKSSQYLHSSPIPSCGCWKRENTSKIKTIDLTGNTYGFLFVIKQIKERHVTSGGNKAVMYLCGCANCGSLTEVKGNNLMSGQTRSCGCVKSYGELEVRKQLLKRNIRFKTQYYFDDLYLNSPNNPLMFDFAILDENEELLYLIEYQGIQHYTQGEFGKQQREITDVMKKEYCAAHGITLYEIRYNEVISESLDSIIAMHANFVPSKQKTV